jgi:hypothetical protein
MRKRAALCLLLPAALTPFSVWAATPTLVLENGGIQFPDGTIQETSAALAGGPATLTVAVDCGAGDSINAALKEPADQLTIGISGICAEDVVIRRNYVTLRGTDPLVDGIGPAGELPSDRPLQVWNTFDVTIENLKLTGGTSGIGIEGSFNVDVVNCRVEGNEYGAFVGAGSWANFEDTVITGNTAGGVSVFTGSHLRCTRCTIEDNGTDGLGTGLAVRQGAELELVDTEVEGLRAIDARGGARVIAYGSTNVIEGLPDAGGYGAAIRAIGSVSVNLDDASIIGPFDAREKSVITLFDTTQTMPPAFTSSNLIRRDSALLAYGTTSLAGDVAFRDFSSGVFPTETSVSGNLTCSSGADVFCDDPATAVGGTSDCGQCTTP